MKKWLAVTGVLVILGTAAILSAQEELLLAGNYRDAEFIDQPVNETNQFVFARLIYNGRNQGDVRLGIPGDIKNWYTDYPKGDEQLIWALRRLTELNIAEHERAVAITDPALFQYPFIYTSEPGQMVLSDKDAAIMREYLQRGGFWMLDDFWGSFEWEDMSLQMEKILPGHRIREIPRSHPIFHAFFDVPEILQVPSLNYVYNGGVTWEPPDGFIATCRGIWADDGRLMVVINHNTDLGDAYEHMDHPQYPYKFSSYAYRIAVNTFVYALSH
jgi:hypothetical protein